MNSTLRKPTAALEEHFPAKRRREIVVESFNDHASTVRSFLAAVRRAQKEDCFVLPAGDYPFPKTVRRLHLRAQRAGTVRLVSDSGVLVEPTPGAIIALEGIHLQHSPDTETVLRMTSGLVILSECRVSGCLEVAGNDTALFLSDCAIGRTPTAVEAKDGASVEIATTAISGCQVALTATSGASLALFGCRIVDSHGTDPVSPGAAIHIEGASLVASGCLFARNEIGINMINAGGAEISYCRFERSSLSSVIASRGKPPRLTGCGFALQLTDAYPHVTLEGIGSVMQNCGFDETAAPPPHAPRTDATQKAGKKQTFDPQQEQFSLIMAELEALVGNQEAKAGLETVLHQAYAAVKRREQGLPAPARKYHMVFEGSEGTGRKLIASLFARALHALGLLPTENIVEVGLEAVAESPLRLAATVQSARGGILFLNVLEESLASGRGSYQKLRDLLQNVVTACGNDTVVIFSGDREVVRPALKGGSERDQIFETVLRFPQPSPGELADLFAALCAEHRIKMTSGAMMKALVTFHLFDDRKDRRFLTRAGVEKLFEVTQKNYLERCSRERNFDLDLEAADIESSLDKSVDAVFLHQPAFAVVCPACHEEIPWMPGIPAVTACPSCGQELKSGTTGVWKDSSYFRRLTSLNEAAPMMTSIPLRRRAVAAI